MDFVPVQKLSYIGGFHVTSSPSCWWTVNKRSLINSLFCPPAFVHFTIVIFVFPDFMKTTYSVNFA